MPTTILRTLVASACSAVNRYLRLSWNAASRVRRTRTLAKAGSPALTAYQSSTTVGVRDSHTVIVSETPVGGVYPVTCIPHGHVGESYSLYGAYELAVIHDAEHGGQST